MNIVKSLALVVLSGGQDSVTCLGMARQEFDKVEAIAFDYGQRHKIELECAREVCTLHGIHLKVVDISGVLAGLVVSALLDDDMRVGQPHPNDASLPSSFVPVRNALFLTLAHGYAQTLGAGVIITGVCQTDYSGYPDCREGFIQLLTEALNKGYNTHIDIQTPLMWATKAQTFRMAAEVGFLREVVDISHTCYEGDHHTRHDWGFGCGLCPACLLRGAGWDEFIAKGGHALV